VPQVRARQGQAPEVNASGDACVYVVGMHRSGTSALTGLLCHLGLGVPREEDQPRASRMNERGFFESKSLCDFDDRLLDHLGGSWKAPPSVAPGWEEDPTLVPHRAEAARLFEATFGERPIVWKDPRAVIVLPFWNTVIKDPLAAVFVYRDPFEVAASLRARNHFRLTLGFALWERYVRAASANLAGLPTFAVSYSSLLGSPESVCDEISSFLAEVSVKVDPNLTGEAIEFLDSSLRHERAEKARRVEVPPSTQAVHDAIRSRNGAYFPWTALDLGPESQWITDTFDAQRELDDLHRRYVALNSARPLRFARKAYAVRDLALARVARVVSRPERDRNAGPRGDR